MCRLSRKGTRVPSSKLFLLHADAEDIIHLCMEHRPASSHFLVPYDLHNYYNLIWFLYCVWHIISCPAIHNKLASLDMHAWSRYHWWRHSFGPRDCSVRIHWSVRETVWGKGNGWAGCFMITVARWGIFCIIHYDHDCILHNGLIVAGVYICFFSASPSHHNYTDCNTFNYAQGSGLSRGTKSNI